MSGRGRTSGGLGRCVARGFRSGGRPGFRMRNSLGTSCRSHGGSAHGTPDASTNFRASEVGSRHRRSKPSRNAVSLTFEYAAIVCAKIAVIVNRHAARIVSVVVIDHDPAVPVRSPRAETPAVTGKEPDRDAHGEADSEPDYQSARGRHQIKPRVGGKGWPPNSPRIVIGN